MQNKVVMFALLFMSAQLIKSSEVNLVVVEKPRFAIYSRLFVVFNKFIYGQSVDASLVYPFSTAMFAAWYNSKNRLFLEIQVAGTLAGFVMCQVLSDEYVYVRLFVLDPAQYSCDLLRTAMEQLLYLKPQLKQLTVLCPSVFVDASAYLLELGFEKAEHVDSSFATVYERYDLQIGPKCMMCDVMYGSDFWEQDGECGLEEGEDDPRMFSKMINSGQ